MIINIFIYIHIFVYSLYIFIQKYRIHDILYFICESPIHRWLSQILVESNRWQIDDEFGVNSPSRNHLFVFLPSPHMKMDFWRSGNFLEHSLSLTSLAGIREVSLPQHSLKILGRMKYSQPYHRVFLPRTSCDPLGTRTFETHPG